MCLGMKKKMSRAILIYSYMYGLVVPFTYQKNLKKSYISKTVIFLPLK